MTRIQVLIADDHKMFIEGVRSSLSNKPNIDICGQARNGEEALILLKTISCHVVLLDINMPKMNGIETCKKIKELYPDIKILALSMHTGQEYIRQMMHAGADGYAVKNIDPEELIRAIERVYEGEQFFSSEVASAMMNPAATSGIELQVPKAPHIEVLSKREIQIVQLIAKEMTSGQIAIQLFISEATVETHRRNIIQKLGVRSSVGIIKYAIKHGLV